MLPFAVAPDRQNQRDQQQNSSKQTPGKIAGRAVRRGFRQNAKGFCGGVWSSWGSLAGCFQIVGNGLFFVEADAAGIGANESFVEDTAGQLAELVLFERLKHARSNLRGGGNLLQGDGALFAFALQFFAKGRQGTLPPDE